MSRLGGAHGVCCQPWQQLLSHSPREVLGVCMHGACPEMSLTPTFKSHLYHTAIASLFHTGGVPSSCSTPWVGFARVRVILPGSWRMDDVRSGTKMGVLQASGVLLLFHFQSVINILFS